MKRNGLRSHLPSTAFMTVIAFIVVIAGAAFIYVGAYNIAADDPHTTPVHALLVTLRERSIAVRAHGTTPPADLSSPQRLAVGAGLYAEMCSNCHLGPGVEPSELSQGLYPQASELAQTQDMTAAEQFWIIKHGVKMSAMPAWGKTHPDLLIWDMVAFVRKLPGMSAEQYRKAVASAPADHDGMMGMSAASHGSDQH